MAHIKAVLMDSVSCGGMNSMQRLTCNFASSKSMQHREIRAGTAAAQGQLHPCKSMSVRQMQVWCYNLSHAYFVYMLSLTAIVPIMLCQTHLCEMM